MKMPRLYQLQHDVCVTKLNKVECYPNVMYSILLSISGILIDTMDILAPVLKCLDISAPISEAKLSWCRSVLGPKCPVTKMFMTYNIYSRHLYLFEYFVFLLNNICMSGRLLSARNNLYEYHTGAGVAIVLHTDIMNTSL